MFFGERTAENMEGREHGMPYGAMHRLHIRCTLRVNGSFAIHGNVEFFGCGIRKSDKG